MPRKTILKGGNKEFSDFFKVFSFDEMRDKTKKKKGKNDDSFINKTAKTISSTSKSLVKMTGLNKVAKKTSNVVKGAVCKTSNVVKGAVRKTSNVVKGAVRKTGKVLIKKRPRRKIKKSKNPKKSKKVKKSKNPKKSKKVKK